MGGEAKKEPLARRDGDGPVRGGGSGIPSIAPAAGQQRAVRASAVERAAIDHQRRATLPSYRATVGITVGTGSETTRGPRSIHVVLNRQQAATLRRLRDGLLDAGEELSDGRPVTDWTKTIRWVLEQIAKCEPKP